MSSENPEFAGYQMLKSDDEGDGIGEEDEEDAMYFETSEYERYEMRENDEQDELSEDDDDEEEEEKPENLPCEIVTIQYGDWDLLSLNQVLPHKELLMRTLALDYKRDFVSLFRGKRQLLGSLKKSGYEFSSSLLLWWAIEKKSLGCVAALIDGSTGLCVDVNSPLLSLNPADGKYYKGLPPLFIAVEQFWSDLVKLFIENGARTDLPCNQSDSPYHMMLPIHLLIHKIREHIYWTPSQTVYALILNIGVTELIEPLKTLKWLMKFSPLEITRDVIYGYAKEGKVIELAVLLYTEAIFRIFYFKPLWHEAYRSLRLVVVEELMMLVEEEQKLSVPEDSTVLCEEETVAEVGFQNLTPCVIKKQKMMCILALLEIFHRTNFYSSSDKPVTEQIARRLLDSGFDLNGEFPYILKEMPDHEHRRASGNYPSLRVEEPLGNLPKCIQPQGLYNTVGIARMLGNEATGFGRVLNGQRGFSSFAFPMFNTSKRLGSRFAFMCGTSSRVIPCNKRELHVPRISFSKKWPIISSFFKKAIKYV